MSALSLDARLLRELRATAVHLLPGDFADALGVSRGQIAEALTRLRGAGFDIEEKPGLGCRLLASPDRLIADDLHAQFSDDSLAREILTFEETSSTNDVAARLGREGHAGGLAVFAERQTAGRGRFGRRWDSAAHSGLWFSLLLRPEFPVPLWPRLTTWAGVCVAAAVERATGLRAQVKWPNDILVAGKKVTGILIESAGDDSGAPFVVAGIGVNVNQTEFPPELADRAASLRQITGRSIERPALAAAILCELSARIADVAQNFSSILAEATRRSALLGSWVRLHSGAMHFERTAESLDADGNLMLRLADGTLQRMTAGEVTTHAPVF